MMNIAEAQLEFRIRYYLWATARAREEVEDSFPHFWLFKGGVTRNHYDFMRQLSRADLDIYVGARLKRSHSAAAKALGESLSRDEQILLDAFRRANLYPSDFENELAARRRTGEKMRFASKRKLQTAMMASFNNAFSSVGMESITLDGYPVPFLRMKRNGWIVQTNFEFGRSESLISFDHLIASEERILHPTTPGVSAPAMVLESMLCWIGLCQMEWKYLMEADIEPACDSVITLCREFFDALPGLLDGIECYKIASSRNPG